MADKLQESLQAPLRPLSNIYTKHTGYELTVLKSAVGLSLDWSYPEERHSRLTSL